MLLRVKKYIKVNGEIRGMSWTRFTADNFEDCREYIRKEKDRLANHKGCTFMFSIEEVKNESNE